jgi:hypothetical protein
VEQVEHHSEGGLAVGGLSVAACVGSGLASDELIVTIKSFNFSGIVFIEAEIYFFLAGDRISLVSLAVEKVLLTHVEGHALSVSTNVSDRAGTYEMRWLMTEPCFKSSDCWCCYIELYAFCLISIEVVMTVCKLV